MKKIYLVLIALIAVVSVSAVSAGLFDLTSDDTKSGNFFEVSGKIIEGTFDYQVTGEADTTNTPGTTVTEDDFEYSIEGSGVVKFNITNATAEELDNISKTIKDYDPEKDDDFYLSVVYEFDGSDGINGADIKSISMEDNVITVEFSGTNPIPEKAESGSGDILSGELEWGDSDNGFSINFYCD